MTPDWAHLTTNNAEYIYHDFEYRDDGAAVVLGNFEHYPSREEVTIDFRGHSPDAVRQLRQLQDRWRHCVWSSFAAHAEMTCFLTLGLDITDMLWLDLFCEARQITGSHTSFYTRKGGLIPTLEAFDIDTHGLVQPRKEAMRQLILNSTVYTDEEWESIVAYNRDDVRVLPQLWEAINQIHKLKRKDFRLRAALLRAEYLKSLAKLEHTSKGFPVDTRVVDLIYGNIKAVRKLLVEECNAQYGGKPFKYNKREDRYSLNFGGLIEYVDNLPFPVDWKTTPTGRLRVDEEYMDEFAKANPHFKPLNDTFRVLGQLKHTDLRNQVKDGFIKGVSIPYYTNTGRNQPLPSRGFLLNLPPWLRHVIRPEPHHVLVMADWGQQEVYLGAALSGDTEMRDALLTGDVYIALAKMAGAVPEDASKKTHPVQRQAFKSTQLGVGYGMGAASLGKRIYLEQPLVDGEMTMSYEESARKAFDILDWHKRTFRHYWAFVDREASFARVNGWMRARDGWTQFCDMNSKFTVLQNFHMQSNGAVMLREAVKELAKHNDMPFKLVCTLHDSIMLYCHEDDAIRVENMLRCCMDTATTTVMRALPMPLAIPVEVKHFSHEEGYHDVRGTALYQRIMTMLEQSK